MSNHISRLFSQFLYMLWVFDASWICVCESDPMPWPCPCPQDSSCLLTAGNDKLLRIYDLNKPEAGMEKYSVRVCDVLDVMCALGLHPWFRTRFVNKSLIIDWVLFLFQSLKRSRATPQPSRKLCGVTTTSRFSPLLRTKPFGEFNTWRMCLVPPTHISPEKECRGIGTTFPSGFFLSFQKRLVIAALL